MKFNIILLKSNKTTGKPNLLVHQHLLQGVLNKQDEQYFHSSLKADILHNNVVFFLHTSTLTLNSMKL